METKYQVTGTSLIIGLPGELDHHRADQIRQEADRILEERPIREILFDFRETIFCDSSGIGLLMGRCQKMRQFGGSVKAIQVSSYVKRLLMLSGIHKLMEIEGTGEAPERKERAAAPGGREDGCYGEEKNVCGKKVQGRHRQGGGAL